MTAPVGLALLAAHEDSEFMYGRTSTSEDTMPVGLSKAAAVILGLPTCILFITLQKYLGRYSLGVFK